MLLPPVSNGCGRCSEYIEWSNSDVVLPEEISDLPDDYRSGDLSLFFKPPSLEVGKIVGIDKVAHLCMYAGLSGMLWIEFLRNHCKYDDVLWHAWIGAVLCPVLMSGAIELLQEYCTTYRGGDWFDFLANICGVTLATLFSYFVLRPWIMKRKIGIH